MTINHRKLGHHHKYPSRAGSPVIGTMVYTTGSITNNIIYYRDKVLAGLTDFGDRHYRLVLYRNAWNSRYPLNRTAIAGLRKFLYTNGIRTGYYSLIHHSTARTKYGMIPVVHDITQPRVWR